MREPSRMSMSPINVLKRPWKKKQQHELALSKPQQNTGMETFFMLLYNSQLLILLRSVGGISDSTRQTARLSFTSQSVRSTSCWHFSTWSSVSIFGFLRITGISPDPQPPPNCSLNSIEKLPRSCKNIPQKSEPERPTVSGGPIEAMMSWDGAQCLWLSQLTLPSSICLTFAIFYFPCSWKEAILWQKYHADCKQSPLFSRTVADLIRQQGPDEE